MLHELPLCILYLLALLTSQSHALPSLLRDSWSLSSISSLFAPPHSRAIQTRSTLENTTNGSDFLWVIQDTYQGKTFFDTFTFFTGADPTHGTVNFLDANDSFSKGLAYVQDDGIVIMKGDNTTTLPMGTNRNSVRISSNAQYNTGLFILDINRAPWGCGVWPAFWTVGGGTWPYTGEIDIIEGVHDNEHNQITWHTGPGCSLDPNAAFTGTVVQTGTTNNTDCDGTLTGNAGCGITEWSHSSYGPLFDSQGGGVFAMKWDETGIAVWSFYRAAVPTDIVQGSPDPSNWLTPDAALNPSGCDPLTFFVNHSIIFDITFCGDWAGNSYAETTCPGTCAEQLMTPSNFDNASWSINSLKVYKKQLLSGTVSAATSMRVEQSIWLAVWSTLIAVLASIGICIL